MLTHKHCATSFQPSEMLDLMTLLRVKKQLKKPLGIHISQNQVLIDIYMFDILISKQSHL